MELEVSLSRQTAIAQDEPVSDSDCTLARQVAAGDVDAWDVLFDRYSPWAYRFAYYHLNGNRADAEDLCSDIMMVVAKSIGGFDSRRGDLDAWVHGVARHRLARFCRGRRCELPLAPDAENSASFPAQAPDMADAAHTRDVVNRALASLPERQAAALIGKYVDGYSTDELARRIDVSPKAVESLLVRGRNAFRSAFNRLLEGGHGGGSSE